MGILESREQEYLELLEESQRLERQVQEISKEDMEI